MPRFDTKKRYVNKKGQKFGKGVWLSDTGSVLNPGESYDRDDTNKTITQYNTDGTKTIFTWEQWAKKNSKDNELRVLQNDRRYGIPVEQDKMMTISVDKNSPTRRNAGATFSENLLDSIAINAKRENVPFSTGLGIVSTESTFGTDERSFGHTPLPWLRHLNEGESSQKNKARNISYKDTYSPSLLISNWNQRNEDPFHHYFYNSQGQLRDTPRTAEFYEEDFNFSRNKNDRYQLEEISPLQHAFRQYKKDPTSYNPNDTAYPKKVEANIRELTQYSPEIKAYMQKHNLKAEGGSLNRSWDDLSLAEKSEMMKVAIKNGITDLSTIRQKYNEFAEGGPEETYNVGYIPEVTIEAERRNNPYIYYDPWSGRYKGIGVGGQRIEYGEGFNPEGSILLPNAQAYENQRLIRAKQDDLNHTNAFANTIRNIALATTVAPMAGPLVEAAQAAAPLLAPGSKLWMSPVTKQLLTGTAMSEVTNLATKAFTGYDTVGQGIGANVEQLTGWNPNNTLLGPLVTEALNPGWYWNPNSVMSTVGKAGTAIENVPTMTKEAADRLGFFVQKPGTFTRGIGMGEEGLLDLINTGIVRGNPRGTEATAHEFTKLFNRNRDHFRDIMKATGIKGIESKWQSRTLTEQEFNAIKEAAKPYSTKRMIYDSDAGTMSIKEISADPLSDYSTYKDYTTAIANDIDKVEQMPARIASGEVIVNPSLTKGADGILRGTPISERFGPNSDYIGDGTPLSYWYTDGRNPITKGYDYAGSKYGIRVNNPEDYTPFMHNLHLHQSFFRSPSLEDPNVEVFKKGLFGITRRMNKEKLLEANRFRDFSTMVERMNSNVEYKGVNPFKDGKMTGFRKWALDNGANPKKILEVEKKYSKDNWKALKQFTWINTDASNYSPVTDKIEMWRETKNFNNRFPHEVEHRLFEKLFGDSRNSISTKDIQKAFKGGDMWEKLNVAKDDFYFMERNYEELLTRFTQIKNALGIKDFRALSEEELKKGYELFKRGVIANNDMKEFFENIKDWKAAAKLSGKALSLAGTGVLTAKTIDNGKN